MYLTIVFLPIISAFIGIIGRILGTTGMQILTTICILFSTIFAIIGFYEVSLTGSPVTIHLISWTNSLPLDISWSILFDDLTISILLAVLIVSCLVHFYSISYINEDPHVQRFISYLSYFTAGIVILVVGDSYLMIFVGWEAIGVASYLLIGFWMTRGQASKSANQAIIVNRVGDTILTIGFIALIWSTGSIEYAVTFSVGINLPEILIIIITLILFGGAISKSAQIPLQTWLPIAMEGPTPASALIHAATLVTAGVYLILRSSPIIEYAPSSLIIISWIGALTAFFAASTGLIQNDFKRIIAYSTCSQLGYLFIAVGLAQYNAALFHLVGHAFFKALLFLAAGAVIHGIADQQDIRRLGGLVSFMPFTYTTIFIGSLSLIALPWLTGFYTKDAILELAGSQFTFASSICYWSGTISAGLTAFYSFRLANISFFSSPNASRFDYEHSHDAPVIIIIPLCILSIFAIGFGYLARDLYIGPGSDFLSSVLPQIPSNQNLIESEFGLTQFIKLLPAFLSIIGALVATWLYNFSPNMLNYMTESSIGKSVYCYLNSRWYLDTIITSSAIIPGSNIGLIISKILDRGLLEFVGPFGLSTILPKTSFIISRLDTGIITTYALAIIIGALSLILISFSSVNFYIQPVVFVLLFIIGLVVL